MGIGECSVPPTGWPSATDGPSLPRRTRLVKVASNSPRSITTKLSGVLAVLTVGRRRRYAAAAEPCYIPGLERFRLGRNHSSFLSLMARVRACAGAPDNRRAA